MSRAASEVLEAGSIRHVCDSLVDNIINRQGTGICPFEAAVLHIVDPETALTAILEKMDELNIRL